MIEAISELRPSLLTMMLWIGGCLDRQCLALSCWPTCYRIRRRYAALATNNSVAPSRVDESSNRRTNGDREQNGASRASRPIVTDKPARNKVLEQGQSEL